MPSGIAARRLSHSHIKGVVLMLTYSELFQLGLLVVAIVALCKSRGR